MKYIAIILSTLCLLCSCGKMLDLYPHSAIAPGAVTPKDLPAMRLGMYNRVQNEPTARGFIICDLLGGDVTQSVYNPIYVIKSFLSPLNGTITGNVGANGGAIAAYGSATYNKTKMEIINCTITGNESKFAGTVEQNGYAQMNIYNSIISGNKAATPGSDNVIVVSGTTANMVAGALPNTLNYSVNGSTVYGDAKAVVAGAFDPATMLDVLADNGGLTQTIKLQGTNNPARTLGMSSILLSSLGKSYSPAIGDEIILKDQTGADRSGSVMGACVK